MSGFFVRHLALSSDDAALSSDDANSAAAAAAEAAAAAAEAAAAAAEAAAAAAAAAEEISAGEEKPASPAAAAAPATKAAATPTAAGGSVTSESPSVPLLADADAAADADADVLADAGANDSDADETEVVAVEDVGVLDESEEAGALWTKSRPRVRYYTHQVRHSRAEEAVSFPSYLGGGGGRSVSDACLSTYSWATVEKNLLRTTAAVVSCSCATCYEGPHVVQDQIIFFFPPS